MNYAFDGKIPLAKLAAICAHITSKSSTPTWLIDSRATSHITNDISAIHSPISYSGEDNVYIGDGQGMTIHHICNSILKTPHAIFLSNNMLDVPEMQLNPLSAYQFVLGLYFGEEAFLRAS